MILRPIAQAERIHIVDTLRGFAVFGIPLVNIAGFASPAFLPGYAPPPDPPWYDALGRTRSDHALRFQAPINLPSLVVIALAQGCSVMALFIMGLLAGRSTAFERLGEHQPILRRVALGGLLNGLAFNALFVFVQDSRLASLGFTIGAPALAAICLGALACC